MLIIALLICWKSNISKCEQLQPSTETDSNQSLNSDQHFVASPTSIV